jgi:hypothetical protein
MKKILILLLTLSIGVFGLTLGTFSANAQESDSVTIPTPVLIPIPNFNCGPGLLTYQSVTFTNGIAGKGIRCVKRTFNTSGNGVHFAWYGEGNVGGCTHRILGHAIFGGYTNSPLNTNTINKAAAADIWGNGECRMQNFNGNLVADTFNNFNNIRISGALTESWILVPSTFWNSLPRPTVCGNAIGLDQYKAVDGPWFPFKSGIGLRCVLQFFFPKTTWFGNGWWNNPNNQYTELGTKSLAGYGASSINGGNYGSIIYNHPYASFNVFWVAGHQAFLNPVKDERWY